MDEKDLIICVVVKAELISGVIAQNTTIITVPAMATDQCLSQICQQLRVELRIMPDLLFNARKGAKAMNSNG